MLGVGSSNLTNFKLEPTTPNMSQQGGQTSATFCTQQCWNNFVSARIFERKIKTKKWCGLFRIVWCNYVFLFVLLQQQTVTIGRQKRFSCYF